MMIIESITLTLFVYGVSVVISYMDDFFNINIDRLYQQAGDNYHFWLQFIMKPTIYCNVCMSSFWGAICYFGLLGQTSFTGYILHAVISAAVIHIINEKTR